MIDPETDKTRFFGEVSASVAHELQNVLAIVKETAGLMQDNLLMQKDALSPEIAETFSKTITRIQEQTERGGKITAGLNGFAHTADLPETGVVVSEVVQRLVFLSRRIFQNMGLGAEVDEIDASLVIKTDPVRFQMLVFNCIRYVGCAESDLTTLQLRVTGRTCLGILIAREFESASGSVSQKGLWDELRRLSAQMNVSLELSDAQKTLYLDC